MIVIIFFNGIVISQCTLATQDCKASDIGCNPIQLLLFSAFFNGFKFRAIRFTADGLDATPSTADDGRGADGVWFTSDDNPVSYIEYEFISKRALLSRDNQQYWFTPNHTYRTYRVGADLQVLTGDDRQVNFVSVNYLNSDIGLYSSRFTGDQGVDMIFGNADDPHYLDKLDTDNQRSIIYSGTGSDQLWNTDDDVPIFATQFSVDGNGQKLTRAQHGLGVDNIPFTGDDTHTDCYNYEQTENRTREINYNPVNTVCFDGDDVVFSYVDYYYDFLGNYTYRNNYSGMGSDATWFTDDDVLASYITYEYHLDGTISKIIEYNSASEIISYEMFIRLFP